MPIDSSAFDTILGAYIKHQNVQHQQAQLQFEKDNAAQLLKQHQQEIDQIAKTHQDDVDFRSMLAKQQVLAHYNELYGHTDPNAASAAQSDLPRPNPQTSMQMDPNGGAPQAQVSDNVQQQPFQQQPRNLTPGEGYSGALAKIYPEGIQIDPNYQARQFEAAKRMQDLEARGAGEKQKAISEAEQPGKESLRRLENEGTLNKEAMQTSAMRDVENARARSAMAVSDNNGRWHLRAAEVARKMDADPDITESVVHAIANGQDLSQFPAKARLAGIKAANAAGLQVAADPKAINKALDNAQGIDEVFNQAVDFANKYSRDGTEGSKGGLASWNPWSKTSAAIEGAKAKVGTLATNLDQNNRKNEAEIMRQLQGNGMDVKQTKAANLENIQKNRLAYAKFIRGAFHGLPQAQVDHILASNDLGAYSSASKTPSPAPTPQSGNVTLRDGAGKTRTMSREQAQKYLNASKDFSIVQ